LSVAVLAIGLFKKEGDVKPNEEAGGGSLKDVQARFESGRIARESGREKHQRMVCLQELDRQSSIYTLDLNSSAPEALTDTPRPW